MASLDIAIGIDLGTSNSCVGVVRNGQVEIIANEQGARITPSFVSFTEDERLTGEAAKYQHWTNPANTVYEVKRLIGRKFADESVQRGIGKLTYKVINDAGNPKVAVQFRGAEKILTPEEISAMVLLRMKEIAETYLGCKVQKAVITVPAYFTDSQRQATIDAGTIAGLKILKIINEPTAAAIAYGEDTNVTKETNILVFDFGGGTFDVAVLVMKKGNYEVKAVSGNSHLGGCDLDARLCDFLLEEFKKKTGIDASKDPKALAKLKSAAEVAKVSLSTSVKYRVNVEHVSQGQDLSLAITQNMFEITCGDLFQQTMQCVDEALEGAGMSASNIEDVVLVGGSSKIPMIQNMLMRKFAGTNIKRTINAAEAVAYGAALQAAKLNNDRTVEDLQLSDVTSQSLGVALDGDIMSFIIKRNTKIPTKCTRNNYTTIYDCQTEIDFDVCEGEDRFASKNNLLGEFKVEKIEIAPVRVPKIDITFELNVNGILNVTAVDTKTGGRGQVTVSVNKGRLLKEDIDRMVSEIRAVEEVEREHRGLIDASFSLESAIEKNVLLLQRKKNMNRISQRGYDKLSLLCEETKKWMDDHEDAKKDEFDQKEHEFNETFLGLLSELGS